MRAWALLLLLSACERDPEALPPPRYPQPIQGNQPNYDNADWAARRSWLTSMMPEVEVKARDVFVKHGLPSLVAGVLVDGQLVWWQGFGNRDLEDGGPVDAHTVYRIGSLTKVITAMALLRLRDEGKVNLDAPASGYVAELADMQCPVAECPPITLRHLLTHTSGLPRLGGFDYASERDAPVTEREILEGLRTLPLERPAGIAPVYSNLGYALLGLVVGRIAGGRYDEYVDTNILAPLGMRSTAWTADSVPGDRLATGYAWDGGQYVPGHEWKMGAAEGMGGLYASLDDMVRFLGYHMSAWPPGARPSTPPLANATLRESHRIGGFQEPAMDGVGLGWMVSRSLGDVLVHHDGATDTHGALAMFLPDQRVGFVALTNTGRPNVLGPLAQDVITFIQKRLGKR